MSDRKPYSLLIVIVVLLVFGGVLYMALDSLTKEFTSVPHASKGQPGGGRGASATALKAAVEKGDIGAIKSELAKGGNINGQFQLLESGRRQISLLTYAAMQGKADLIKALIEAGAKPEAASDDWGTPLMMAAAKGDLASLNELLKAGAKVDDRNKWGETALIKAATLGNVDNVKALLDAGASVSITDAEGNSALALSAGSDAPAAIVKMLIDAKSDVDSANRDGVTPLMQAAKLGDVQKCVLLLDAGAKAGLKDNNNWTAKEWANQRQDENGKKCEELLAQAAH
jgi:ankyrin repeat protein